MFLILRQEYCDQVILQISVQEYETNVDKYNGTLEDAGATVAKKPHVATLSDAVQKEVMLSLLRNLLLLLLHF